MQDFRPEERCRVAPSQQRWLPSRLARAAVVLGSQVSAHAEPEIQGHRVRPTPRACGRWTARTQDSAGEAPPARTSPEMLGAPTL
jgi:hypothetical protein